MNKRVLNKNQKDVVNGYMVNQYGNGIYFSDEQILNEFEYLLKKNMLNRIFDYNMWEDIFQEFNESHEKVIGDFINAKYEENAIHAEGVYIQEYYLLVRNNALHELFEVDKPYVDTAHFNATQKRILIEYFKEVGENNSSDEALMDLYNQIKNNNQIHKVFEWHNKYASENNFTVTELALLTEFTTKNYVFDEPLSKKLVVKEYKHLKKQGLLFMLFEYNAN